MTTSTKHQEHVAKELKRAKLLATGIRATSPTVSPELDRQNLSTVREGETAVEAAAEQERNARLLDGASHELTEAGRQHREAVATRSFFFDERTTWFSISRGELFSAKSMVQAKGGVKAVYRLGLKGALAESPEKLILQGQDFLERLANPLALRTKAEEIEIDTALLIERLAPPFAELGVRHDLALEADQNVATALKAKDDAYSRLRLLNQTIAQETFAAWRRAGFKKLAARLRRQLYQVMRTPGSGNTTTPEEGQDPTSPTPNPGTTPDPGATPADTDPTTGTETPDDTPSSDEEPSDAVSTDTTA